MKKIVLSVVLTGIMTSGITWWSLHHDMNDGHHGDLQLPVQSKANVYPVQGIYVFIYSEPQVPYTSLGYVDKRVVEEILLNTKGKKGGDILKEFGKAIINNIDLGAKLQEIISVAINEKPGVQGLIFRENLQTCEAITFAN
ncbi:hypothetical protein COB64_03770 [Candidatus Wolfebacteria bacterium]|nr:MAG: hypothetical protein COB64_03770 [Candidatus Wolfebacteria bacterium]